MGAWHDRPGAYPHHCVQCERATPETGPFHRGATITVAVRGGRGEVDYTLWTCQTCIRTAMAGVMSPFAGWGPPAAPIDLGNGEMVTSHPNPAGVAARLRELADDFDQQIADEPAPVKRGPGRPRKAAA